VPPIPFHQTQDLHWALTASWNSLAKKLDETQMKKDTSEKMPADPFRVRNSRPTVLRPPPPAAICKAAAITMGSLFSRPEDERRGYFIRLSGPDISIVDAVRHRVGRLAQARNPPPHYLILCLPRQEDAQRVDPEMIDCLAETLSKSLGILELELRLYDGQIPSSICRAVALNRSVRGLILDTRDTDDELPYDLMDAIQINSTIKNLFIRGNVNRMANSLARLLVGAPSLGIQNLKLFHNNAISDFRMHVRYGAIDAEQMNTLVQAIRSCKFLSSFVFGSSGGAVHYSNSQLATLFQSPSLQSLSLREMKLCGGDGHQIYAALSCNQQLRELKLTSFSKFAQVDEIREKVEDQFEAALRDHNTTLRKLSTCNTIQTTGRIQHWLSLNAAGRSLIRNLEQADKLLPHILARTSDSPDQLYGLLREATGTCICNSPERKGRKT